MWMWFGCSWRCVRWSRLEESFRYNASIYTAKRNLFQIYWESIRTHLYTFSINRIFTLVWNATGVIDVLSTCDECRVAELEDWPRDKEWMRFRDSSQFTTETLSTIAQDSTPGLQRVAIAMNEFLGRDNKDIPDKILREVNSFSTVIRNPWGFRGIDGFMNDFTKQSRKVSRAELPCALKLAKCVSTTHSHFT